MLGLCLALTATMACRQPATIPPEPVVSGPTQAATRTQVSYSALVTDWEDEAVQVRFDWGDGDTSGWTNFTSAGNTARDSHAWLTAGRYEVRAQAASRDSIRGPWSEPLAVALASAWPDSVVQDVQLDGRVRDLALSPDEERLYVLTYDPVGLVCLDTRTLSVIGSVPGLDGLSLCVLPDGERVCVVDWRMYVVRVADWTVPDTVSLGMEGYYAELQPGTGMLYVSRYNFAGSSVRIFRTDDFERLGSIDVEDDAYGLAFSQNGDHLYLCSGGGNTVDIWDTGDTVLIRRASAGLCPTKVAVSPDGKWAAAVACLDHSLTLIRTADHVPEEMFQIGPDPWDLQWTPDSRYVLVGCDFRLSALDITARRVWQVELPIAVSALALTADGSRLYAGSGFSQNLLVLERSGAAPPKTGR